jgi:hypothetical protein
VFFDVGYSAAVFDPLGERMYVLDGVNIMEWNAGSAMMVNFKSKVFRLPEPGCPSVGEVIADGYPVTMKLYAGQYGESGWVQGGLRTTKTITSRAPINLGMGYTADDVQIELSSAHPITGVVVAGSMAELKN